MQLLSAPERYARLSDRLHQAWQRVRTTAAQHDEMADLWDEMTAEERDRAMDW